MRDGGGGRYILGWLAAGAGFALLRWLLPRGVYRVSLEGQRVVRHGGFWSADFVTWVSLGTACVMAAVLGWQMLRWIAGRKDRSGFPSVHVHRRILK